MLLPVLTTEYRPGGRLLEKKYQLRMSTTASQLRIQYSNIVAMSRSATLRRPAAINRSSNPNSPHCTVYLIISSELSPRSRNPCKCKCCKSPGSVRLPSPFLPLSIVSNPSVNQSSRKSHPSQNDPRRRLVLSPKKIRKGQPSVVSFLFECWVEG